MDVHFLQDMRNPIPVKPPAEVEEMVEMVEFEEIMLQA